MRVWSEQDPHPRFRGEAIPSIAAVSRMDFTSRTADGLNGTMVKAVERDNCKHVQRGCPPGSTVVVRDCSQYAREKKIHEEPFH